MDNVLSLELHYIAICKSDEYYYWAVLEKSNNKVVKKARHLSYEYEEALQRLQDNMIELELNYPNIGFEDGVIDVPLQKTGYY